MYKFDKPLIEGLIIKRKNRFIMKVNLDGVTHACHCPTTGRIGNIVLSNIPCLLSQSNDMTRKTAYTVEAISLDLPSERNKTWIGINQNAANRYVEHFLKMGELNNLVLNGNLVKREQKLGNSRLDFLVENTYIEIKTPLALLQVALKEHIRTKKVSEFNSFDRFIKHISELADSLKTNERAILLDCFMYDHPGLKVNGNKKREHVKTVVHDCLKRGVEIWQINLKIAPEGVELIKYFDITDNFR